MEQKGKKLEEKGEEKGEEIEEKGKEEIDALKTNVSEKSKEIKTSLQAIMEKAKMEAEQGLIEIEDSDLPVLRADESKMTLNPIPNPNAGPSL